MEVPLLIFKNMQTFESFKDGREDGLLEINPANSILLGAQTFVPSISHFITQVKVLVNRTATGTGYLGVEIRNASGGVPVNESALAYNYYAMTINSVSDSPTWYVINLNNKVKLQSGTKYAIVIGPFGGSGGLVVRGPTSDGYARGELSWMDASGLLVWHTLPYDMHFEEMGYTDSGLFFCMG